MSTVALVSLMAGLANLVGGWSALRLATSQERSDQLMALGAGFILGSAFFTMLPAALSGQHHDSGIPSGAVAVAAGYFAMLLLRTLLGQLRKATGAATESAWGAFLGMSLHCLIDGGALGMLLAVNSRIGLLILPAVLLHKIPEGISLATVVRSATGSANLALLAAALVGVATVSGSATGALWVGALQASQAVLLGAAGGTFLYISATDMLPSLLKKRGTLWPFLCGVAILFLLTRGIGHTH